MRAHALLVVFALSLGCSESHSNTDGSMAADARIARDAPSDDCPPIGAPLCVDTTCCAEEAAAILQPGCHYACPSGFADIATCDPAASCTDFSLPCARPSDCTLAIDDCCGPCGVPALDDFDAIATSRADAHTRFVCPDPGSTPCPGCVAMDNPSLGATCTEGRCTGFDVRQLAISACTDDSVCRLRTRDCCECGGSTDPSSLIAVRGDARAAYMELVCDDFACGACEPTYPTTVEAYCATDGHCAVRAVP